MYVSYVRPRESLESFHNPKTPINELSNTIKVNGKNYQLVIAYTIDDWRGRVNRIMGA